MLMAVQLVIGEGRVLETRRCFLARVIIEKDVAALYDPDSKADLKLITEKIRVVRFEMENLFMTLGGLVTVHHGHPNPQIRGRQIVYREYRMQPRWESDYARDNRMELPSEKLPTK